MSQSTLDAVYEFVSTYITEHGFPPSLREIAAVLGCSSSTSNRYLDRLQAQGRIVRTPMLARSIRLISPVPQKMDSIVDSMEPL